MISKTLSTRKYKAGYEIRTEEVQLFEGDIAHIRKYAYTPDGWCIGNSKKAYHLCVKQGIKPELIAKDHTVCSIGFCDADAKWYGWSHRAIYGFGIGSSVKVGDCGYVPSNVDVLANEYRSWNDSVEIVDDTTIRVFNKMCDVVGDAKDGSVVLEESNQLDQYDVETGRGEWIAETLDDARQMACDFASGVA